MYSVSSIEKELMRIESGSFFRSDLEKIKNYLKNCSRKEEKVVKKAFASGLKEAIKEFNRRLSKDKLSIYKETIEYYKSRLKMLRYKGRIELEGVVITFNSISPLYKLFHFLYKDYAQE